jgi:D-lactate dehydrogenase
LFDRAAFAKCRRGVFIVNTARGGLIETDALCEALDSGVVAGAGLDVLEDERVMRRETSHIIGDQIIERLHANFPPRELRAPDNSRIKELQSLMLHHKLLERPSVLFTPHIAFNSTEAIERILTVTVENIRGFLNNAPINVVRARAGT